MASLIQWAWVWESSRRWWRTGKPGMLQPMGSQRVRHDWVTELNWYYIWNLLRVNPKGSYQKAKYFFSISLTLHPYWCKWQYFILFMSELLLLSSAVVSDSLWPHDSLWLHGLQHTRLPCPSPSPGPCSNSCPFSWWCHPTISSSIVPFSFLQSFPASGSFLMS